METGNKHLLDEILPLPGVCNLCLNDGELKSMMIKIESNGNSSSCIEMLLKCFSIDVLALEMEHNAHFVCNICFGKLNDCVKFRDQVETSLKALEIIIKKQKNKHHFIDNIKEELSDEAVMEDDFSAESVFNHVEDVDALHDVKQECDDLVSGVEEKNKSIRKKKVRDAYHTRKSRKIPKKKSQLTSKREAHYTRKNNKDTTDTEKLLNAGLFPFKISKDRTFSCVICREKSKNLDDIKTHVSDHSILNLHDAFKKVSTSRLQRFCNTSNKLKCKLCKTDILNYDDLRRHLDSCINSNAREINQLPFNLEKGQLDCRICKKHFGNFSTLTRHMNEHYPNFTCENCGKNFATRIRLRNHMRTHELGDFPCKYCGAVFDKFSKRENHVTKEHKSGRRYVCRKCNITLSSFYTRQKHFAEVHNEELKQYKCKACSQCYVTPGHLSSHVRRDHLNERNHKCPECDLAFYTKNSLKMHMVKHDGERKFTCHYCNKSYQRLKTLREHLRIHTNDKRFVCPICARGFIQKCTLKGHMRVHSRRMEMAESFIRPPDPEVAVNSGIARSFDSVLLCRTDKQSPES